MPGRPRLPYGEAPAKAYNLNLFQLDALFASHELSAGPKPAGEFRVLLIGESGTGSVDDVSAIYWNPGELAFLEGQEISLTATEFRLLTELVRSQGKMRSGAKGSLLTFLV